jgi:hypothetical protein
VLLSRQAFAGGAVQFAGTHAGGVPQTLDVPPPPQVSLPEHVPQSSVPPQPSGSEPQLAPRSLHECGVHVVEHEPTYVRQLVASHSQPSKHCPGRKPQVEQLYRN